MAVVQISKIQLRRGKKNTQGLPQLASGEMAWAIDTQELYIGNGAVGEGAPAVGNTKVLTENDNILDLLEQYQYKPNDSTIQSGLGVNFPTQRTLQERLDEGKVNAASFGITANVPEDQTALIQNAIYSLYLPTTMANQVALEFDPGTYNISGTVYLPSNTHIIGNGKNSTIFKFNKGGINSSTTFAVSGATATAGTYTNLTPETTTGNGDFALINIALTGVGPNYTLDNTTITVLESGAGYAPGDIITIKGSQIGGTDVINDLSITLNTTIRNQVFDTSTVFEFINDTSLRNYKDSNPTSYINQPKNISLNEFKIDTNNNQVRGFNFNNVRDSRIINVSVTGTNGYDDYTSETSTDDGSAIIYPILLSNSVALEMSATADFLCTGNHFVGFEARGFTYGVLSNTEIKNNHFDKCIFKILYMGINFGSTAAVGNNGPIKNTIEHSLFETITRHGILISKGYGNRSHSNTFVNVGGPNGATAYGQIKFTTAGNSSTQDNFDRARDLARDNLSAAYVAEIEGHSLRQDTAPTTTSLDPTTSPAVAIRLPLNAVSGFEISYVFNSTTFGQMRKGTMYLAVDRDNSTVQLVDDYEYVGASGEDSNILFTAAVGTDGTTGVKSVKVSYINLNSPPDVNALTYTYIALS
jgi:hypothetical protein